MEIMSLVLITIFFITVLINGIYPKRSTSSIFELTRRKELGDKSIEKQLEREDLVIYILSIKNIKIALLVVIFTVIAVFNFGWWGIFVSVLMAVSFGRISRFRFIRKLSNKFYGKFEDVTFKTLHKIKPYLDQFRSLNPSDIDKKLTIDSKYELMHLINDTSSVLTQDEKKLILAGLAFNDKTVSEIMTARADIKTVSKKDFLGPLVLDELHKIGHSCLPVIDGDIDNVVGILDIKSLLSLDDKKSSTVAKAMKDKVYYVHENQKLIEALSAFLKSKQHLFIVINSKRETRGLLTLEDIIESLIGKKIHYEFQSHNNVNAVAARGQDS